MGRSTLPDAECPIDLVRTVSGVERCPAGVQWYISTQWFADAVLRRKPHHDELKQETDDDAVARAELMGEALAVLMAWRREWNGSAGDYIPLVCSSSERAPPSPTVDPAVAAHIAALVMPVPHEQRMALVECLPLRAEDIRDPGCQFQWRHKQVGERLLECWFVRVCEQVHELPTPPSLVGGFLKEKDCVRMIDRRLQRDPDLPARLSVAARHAGDERGA
eukprot:gene18832-65875_t